MNASCCGDLRFGKGWRGPSDGRPKVSRRAPVGLTCYLLSLLTLRATVFQNLNALFDARVDSIRVETVFGEEQLGVAVRDEAIWNPHPHDFDLVLKTVLFQKF